MKRTSKYKPFYHEESGITFTTFQQVREYVWNSRPHVSQLTGKRLFSENHPQWHWQFLHVIGRNNTYWVLNPDNILLALPSEHENQEQYPEFITKREELKAEYYKQFYKL